MLALLIAEGCDIKRGKTISIRAPEQKRFKRLDSLGEEYSEQALKAILAGKRIHTPRRSRIRRENLVLELQVIAQNRSTWASVMTAKQVANTINYLEDNHLFQYQTLCDATDRMTRTGHDLNDKVKQAELRLSEIAVLKTHIINYIKTREVYTAYRKSGYSKKYLAEHEGDILLHKAAKKAFDELGVKKLPTIKMLQAEYAELLAQKKKDYAKYRQVKKNMEQLTVVRHNVDLLRARANDEDRHQERQTPATER